MLYVRNVDKDHSMWKMVEGRKRSMEWPDDGKMFSSTPISLRNIKCVVGG
jgi:hypothetical protein